VALRVATMPSTGPVAVSVLDPAAVSLSGTGRAAT
jgi:hypothetical protein